MSTAIVIVNYRTADLTIQCLRSLAPEVGSVAALQIVVVDNASGDGSAERISEAIGREAWGRWARVLPLDGNRGFAAGNNAGIAFLRTEGALPDYVMLLNSDTLVQSGAIRAMVDFMDAHPRVGIGGSRLLDAEGVPQSYAKRFPCLLAELESGFRLGIVTRLLAQSQTSLPPAKYPHAADWVSGAAFCIRREVLQQVGELDEGYFLYYEEVDYCRRAKTAGWEVWGVSDSRIVHLEGASTGLCQAQRRLPKYWFDSRLRYFSKHRGRVYAALAELAFEVGYCARRVRQVVEHRAKQGLPRRLQDGWRYIIIPCLLGY